ncbi:hypothetical protein [Chondromyces crocatus]|uniref:HIRAN domain-containing protein n=1 Tax=Chondromyces crocatus TaxID=52 RepID=A0A0K1EJN9_CHOCO|nr:hypothetical protein [Chondromyces crocatus]AKT40907.1 uncharacterized protein CMC5_050640 [Chondromyces crocatus]
MTSTRTLFVTWFSPEQRSSVMVGRLVHHRDDGEEFYEFRYIRSCLEAVKQGFQPFLAFPELHRSYRSRQLFPFFSNRVIPTSRPEFIPFVRTLGLNPTAADAMDILGRSGGRRETDRVELIAAPVRDESGSYTTHFLLRGVGHFPEAEERIEKLATEEPLFCRVVALSDANPKAVMLWTTDAQAIGFMPGYLTHEVAALLHTGRAVHVSVEQVNPPPISLHYRVLCRLTAQWPAGVAPFHEAQFEPLDAGHAAATGTPESCV